MFQRKENADPLISTSEQELSLFVSYRLMFFSPTKVAFSAVRRGLLQLLLPTRVPVKLQRAQAVRLKAANLIAMRL